MNKIEQLPVSGYLIDSVYANHLTLKLKNVEEGEADAEGKVGFGWDWRLVLDAEQPTFEVRIIVSVEPTPEREEELVAGIVGRFRPTGENPPVPVGEFVRLQAPAILLPYARQALSSLSSLSFGGTYYLPPLNVVELMKDFDPTMAAGAKQLEEIQKTLASTAKEAEGDTQKHLKKPAKRKRKRAS